MKINNYLKSALFASMATSVTSSISAGIDDVVRKDAIIQMQEVKTTGPAMAGVQIKIQGKIYLLLLDSNDAILFPETLGKNIRNTESKVRGVVQKMISNGKIYAGANVSIESYGTTTAVDIGEGRVGFLTASHVIEKEPTQNDVCITNRVIGEDLPKIGLSILEVSSQKLNGKMSYTQFPFFSQGKFMMLQIPSILRYEGMKQWIQGRFEKFVGGASGGPVISENPNKKGEYGIVSIFPGGVSSNDGSYHIAEMPRNEVLNEIKKEALKQSKKGGEYSICR